MKCDIDVRRDMYANMVLSGGSTMFKGLKSRLGTEIASVTPRSVRVKISAHKYRTYAVWIGGSILANMNSFEQMAISREEFEETGSTIVHRKCI